MMTILSRPQRALAVAVFNDVAKLCDNTVQHNTI